MAKEGLVVKTFTSGTNSFTVPAGITQVMIITEYNQPSYRAKDAVFYGAVFTFLDSNGIAYSSGAGNSANAVGKLGTNSSGSKSVPTAVAGDHSFTSIYGANQTTWALKADGSVWAWGVGTDGQLGQGTTAVNRSSPVSVVGNKSFSQISATYYSVAGIEGSTGLVWMWGQNTYGELGDGTTFKRSSPTSVFGGQSFTKVHASDGYTYALKADGSIWAWGYGLGGQLGMGTSAINRSTPVAVVGPQTFVDITTVQNTSAVLALRSDGTAWAWGSGNVGQLGQGTTAVNRSSPVSVVGGHSFTKIIAKEGALNPIFIKADGTAWSWGGAQATSVQIFGETNTANFSSPVQVLKSFKFNLNDKFISQTSGACFIRYNDGNYETYFNGTASNDNTNGEYGFGSTYNDYPYYFTEVMTFRDNVTFFNVTPNTICTVDMTTSDKCITNESNRLRLNTGNKISVIWIE